MDQIKVTGGARLSGTIPISGAKNAALPLMTASLLTADTLRLTNLPRLADIETLSLLLEQHGVSIDRADGAIALTAGTMASTTAPYDLVRRMRASVLVLGPLVARCGEAKVSLPGGCAIGSRPVDVHLHALEQMGARIELGQGYIQARAPSGLHGAHIVFPMVSVGATENILMAATLAKGESLLENCAREPEITDLAECLVEMGAKIEGIGTATLKVQGVSALGGTEHAVVADRIEAGTYAVAAAITRGDIHLTGARAELLGSVVEVLSQAGISVKETGNGLYVSCEGSGLSGVDVMTDPFPGFPTDLQAQIMALMVTADGASMITEAIFENRFMHVPELARMGANINLHGASAMVRGVKRLFGAEVMATDLRASSSLVLAGLVAEGETVINRVYHLDRGYERLEEKLSACGARIERVKGPGAAEMAGAGRASG